MDTDNVTCASVTLIPMDIIDTEVYVPPPVIEPVTFDKAIERPEELALGEPLDPSRRIPYGTVFEALRANEQSRPTA